MSLLDKAIQEMDIAFGGSQGPNDCECDGTRPEEATGKLVSFQRLRNQQEEEEGMANEKDVLSFDIPALIRLFELVRENIKDDAQLHHLVDDLLSAGESTFTMDDYDEIAAKYEGEEDGGSMELSPPEEDEPMTIESFLKINEEARKRQGWYRSPRTQNERKASEGGGVRAKRSKKNLASAYDDNAPTWEKNWKKYRKTQYKGK